MNMDQDGHMLMVEDNFGNQFRPNAVQNVKNQVVYNAVQNLGIQIVENMNRLSVVLEITNQYRNRNVVTTPAEGNGNGINEAANFVRDFKSLAKEADESLVNHKALELEIERLLRAVVFPKVGESNALSKPVTSNSTPSSRKSTIVNNERVIAPGIFRINPFKASRVDTFMPNKHVKASVKTKPITVSQPYVITKKDLNSITNGFSPKNVKSTTRTRRPQPMNNPKNDKVPSKSKSSCLSNKLEKIEKNHRSL
nr:hypothetical protein [Tanacetum cinerariifolium]